LLCFAAAPSVERTSVEHRRRLPAHEETEGAGTERRASMRDEFRVQLSWTWAGMGRAQTGPWEIITKYLIN
jgi:hypothetical protein